MEFGSTLRAAREEKGLSTSEIAQKTHMLIQHVEALEREDFSKIAAPIYGRGFVKLYCEAVGLDPRPFVQEFMDIYNGNKRPAIRMRPQRQAPPPKAPTPPPDDIPPPPPVAPVTPVPPVSPAPLAPVPPDTPVPQDEPTPVPPAPEPQDSPAEASPPESDFRLVSEEAVAPQAASRPSEDGYPGIRRSGERRPLPDYAVSVHPPKGNQSLLGGVPPFVWRIAALAVAAGIVLWLLVAGIKLIYRASMGGEDASGESAETAPAAEAQPVAEAKPAAEKAEPARRTPMKLPPLYIDRF
jgi:transcriptional regulator with XRE-family HTH domain